MLTALGAHPKCSICASGSRTLALAPALSLTLPLTLPPPLALPLPLR